MPKKGSKWYHGTKAHIGVDMSSKLVHSMTFTAANIADVTQLGALMHDEKDVVYGDGGYIGGDFLPQVAECELPPIMRPNRPSRGIPTAGRLAGESPRCKGSRTTEQVLLAWKPWSGALPRPLRS